MNSKLVMLMVIYILSLYSLQAIYLNSSGSIKPIEEMSQYEAKPVGFWSRLRADISKISEGLKFIGHFLNFDIAIPVMPYRLDYFFRIIFIYPVWIFGIVQIINLVRGTE